MLDLEIQNYLLKIKLIHMSLYCFQIATGLGEFMGRTHAATHSTVVPAERAAFLHSHFENRAMRDLQLEFVFTKVICSLLTWLATNFSRKKIIL